MYYGIHADTSDVAYKKPKPESVWLLTEVKLLTLYVLNAAVLPMRLDKFVSLAVFGAASLM